MVLVACVVIKPLLKLIAIIVTTTPREFARLPVWSIASSPIVYLANVIPLHLALPGTLFAKII
jgi:hypothetical protein